MVGQNGPRRRLEDRADVLLSQARRPRRGEFNPAARFNRHQAAETSLKALPFSTFIKAWGRMLTELLGSRIQDLSHSAMAGPSSGPVSGMRPPDNHLTSPGWCLWS